LRVLYITYYGLRKHLCHTQVIPYLEGLATDGAEVSVLSFEEASGFPSDDLAQNARIEQRLSHSQIRWYRLPYHKSPSLPATAYDVLAGSAYAAHLVRRQQIDIIHARNHIPALMGLVVKWLLGSKLVFDLRGLMAEEYVDAGTWRENSLPYRLVKWVESRSLREADGIVMLTRKLRRLLQQTHALARTSLPVEIIPCCVDTQKYIFSDSDRSTARTQLKIEGKLVLAYTGSLGGWYMAEEMAILFSELLSIVPDAHFLVMTQSPHHLIASHLERLGVPPTSYSVQTLPSDDVPRYLAAADFAVTLIKPCFSKISSSPTKIGEYLASGLPFVTNRGIGDVDELVESQDVGVFAEAFDRTAYRHGITKMLAMLQDRTTIRNRCKRVAQAELSLESIGKRRYRDLYARMFPDEVPASEPQNVATVGAAG
jgi:glycosyltransferase involved in cell wall biosynthesis